MDRKKNRHHKRIDIEKKLSKDPDANGLKKTNKTSFGHQNFVFVIKEDKSVRTCKQSYLK